MSPPVLQWSKPDQFGGTFVRRGDFVARVGQHGGGWVLSVTRGDSVLWLSSDHGEIATVEMGKAIGEAIIHGYFAGRHLRTMMVRE